MSNDRYTSLRSLADWWPFPDRRSVSILGLAASSIGTCNTWEDLHSPPVMRRAEAQIRRNLKEPSDGD